MNTTELNKLKKADLVELSAKLQDEQSELTRIVAALQHSETELRDHVASLQDELAEKELLQKKYEKAKQLLREYRSAQEILRIEKPLGQVDRDYNLHEAMTGEGRLEVTADTYRKLLEFVREGVAKSGMDKMVPWKKQNPEHVCDVIVAARESFPFLKHYANTWPVTDAIIRYLANHRKYKKSKNAKKDKAGAGHENGDGEAPPPPGVAGGVGDGEGEDEDDVELSD